MVGTGCTGGAASKSLSEPLSISSSAIVTGMSHPLLSLVSAIVDITIMYVLLRSHPGGSMMFQMQGSEAGTTRFGRIVGVEVVEG